MVNGLPTTAAAVRKGTRAVHSHAVCRQLRFVSATAAHLKATARDGALNVQAGHLDGQRLQEENGLQRRVSRGDCACCRTCELKVARTGEDDAGVDDMIGHEGVHGASDR